MGARRASCFDKFHAADSLFNHFCGDRRGWAFSRRDWGECVPRPIELNIEKFAVVLDPCRPFLLVSKCKFSGIVEDTSLTYNILVFALHLLCDAEDVTTLWVNCLESMSSCSEVFFLGSAHIFRVVALLGVISAFAIPRDDVRLE